MQSLIEFGSHLFVLISVCVTALCEIIVDDVAATMDDDLSVKKKAMKTAHEWWIYVLFCGGGILLVLALIQLFAKIWSRLHYNRKLHKDGLQKPLTLQPRKPTTAVKSPAAPGVITHYLKKSPSPTAVSPTDRGTNGYSPTPNSGKEITPPKDGLIPDGTNGSTGFSATEDKNAGNKQLVEADSTTGNEQPMGGSKNEQKKKKPTNEDPNDLGRVMFSVRYKKERNVLLITVNRCVNLPTRDMSSNTDPYVKLQLLPEKQHKVKTRVLRKTRNPIYDEDFSFYGIKYHQLQTITLHFIVLTFDRYSRDEVVGEIFFPLALLDLSQENKSVAFDEKIQPRKVKEQGRGEILVSLCWQPAANRLTVVVLKARNLPKMDVTGLADPYVKIYLMYKGQRIAKKKTHVKKRTLNPVFNESFIFEIPATPDGLDSISLEFMLLDWDRVTKNEVIGRLNMGKQCEYQSTAWQHWSQVCNCPRRQIADWHKLIG